MLLARSLYMNIRDITLVTSINQNSLTCHEKVLKTLLQRKIS